MSSRVIALDKKINHLRKLLTMNFNEEYRQILFTPEKLTIKYRSIMIKIQNSKFVRSNF